MKRVRPMGVLVTGAGPGIGAECVEALRAGGRQVTDFDAKDRWAIAEYSATLNAAPRAGIEPMAVNLRAPFLFARTLCLRLRASRSFRICRAA